MTEMLVEVIKSDRLLPKLFSSLAFVLIQLCIIARHVRLGGSTSKAMSEKNRTRANKMMTVFSVAAAAPLFFWCVYHG